MTIGELKKRLLPTFELESKEHILAEILDEARADIFDLWNKHPRYVAMRQKKGDYTSIRCFYKARDDWLYELENKLEKWFGGAEK